MTDLEAVQAMVVHEHGLAVVAVARDDGTVGASVVNAGVIEHPYQGGRVVAFVSGAESKRLDRLRAGRPITVTFRHGWSWISVEGRAQLIGPDDLSAESADVDLPRLLRAIFSAAGGIHDHWAAYDKAMTDERRVAVLVRPSRIYSNPSSR